VLSKVVSTLGLAVIVYPILLLVNEGNDEYVLEIPVRVFE